MQPTYLPLPLAIHTSRFGENKYNDISRPIRTQDAQEKCLPLLLLAGDRTMNVRHACAVAALMVAPLVSAFESNKLSLRHTGHLIVLEIASTRSALLRSPLARVAPMVRNAASTTAMSSQPGHRFSTLTDPGPSTGPAPRSGRQR